MESMGLNIKIYFDGAVSKSQLGCDMGLGIAVFVDNIYEEELSKFVGVKGNEESSSNVAEWMACVEAFKLALEYKQEGDTIEIYSDSQLITNQFNGNFEIKEEKFRKYYREAIRHYNKLGSWGLKIQWVKRELNREADRLSKLGLKQLVV
jgi:ribonuclease HI